MDQIANDETRSKIHQCADGLASSCKREILMSKGFIGFNVERRAFLIGAGAAIIAGPDLWARGARGAGVIRESRSGALILMAARLSSAGRGNC